MLVSRSPAESKTVVLRLDDRRRLDDIVLPAPPSNAIASANGLKLYVDLPSLSRITVIDAPALELAGSIAAPEVAPVALSAVTDRSYCH